MNNLQLFEECLENDEEILIPYYQTIIQENDWEIIKHLKLTKKLKEKLITIKNQKEQWDNYENTLLEIWNIIFKNWKTFSEFWCFMHSADITISVFENIKKEEWQNKAIKVLDNLINLYLKNREINEITTKEFILALYDDSTSRRNWKSGEEKVRDILIKKWYTFMDVNEKWKLFQEIQEKSWFNKTKFKKEKQKFFWKYFLNCSKACAFISSRWWIFNHETIRNNIWSELSKTKSADILVKKWDLYYVIEAKHLKEEWWTQNNQRKEIKNLSYDWNEKIKTVWFNDWVYWNFYIKKKYKNDIVKALKENWNFYFINTYWLEKLF